ncbi:NAD(+) diphosphatase [candidate division KSB1 bacterium]|nr:NAD(+) diphosphatase [candidate division KSB1 bacterium]
MEFISAIEPATELSDNDLLFVIQGKKILVETGESGIQIPLFKRIKSRVISEHLHYLGSLGSQHCYAQAMQSETIDCDQLQLLELRSLFDSLPENLFWIAARAMHIIQWDLASGYCSVCGSVTTRKTDERAKVCLACGQLFYPHISPAIIVAILRDRELLLVNHVRSPEHLYTLVAGFVEPGETLEECVIREAQEEVGIVVGNIRYFGSQPWAFSNSLMIGFIADYKGGDLQLQKSEIRDANWYFADNLPHVTGSYDTRGQCSIAWHLISWYRSAYG